MRKEFIHLVVVYESGETKKIHVPLPVEVTEGKVLNRITCANGTEYFFTKDGYYDGWGRPVSGDPDKLDVGDF